VIPDEVSRDGLCRSGRREQARPPLAQGGRRAGVVRVIEGGTTPRRDSVKRLHVFQGEQPAVQFTSPTGGLRAHGRYAALIPPGTIPGETREITVTSADLCGLMDQLNDLFSSAD
jgi:hypothetical protein